jgi:DNA polymerase, archaea type
MMNHKNSMEIDFYPFDFEYKVKEDKTYLHIYAKLKDNKKICVIHEFKPYFYVKINDIDTQELAKRLKNFEIETTKDIPKIVSWEETEKELLGKNQKLWKVKVNYPRAVSIISKELSSWGLDCYDTDILFIHSYLRDNKILPMTLVKAEGKFQENYDDGHNNGELKIPAFIADKIEQVNTESMVRIKYLAVDIECYSKHKEILPEQNPILMIGFYGIDETGNVFKKVLTWKDYTDLDYVEKLKDEKEMLLRFKEIINEYQPEIITGYFSDGFDFPYIRIRADKFNVKLDLGLDGSELITSGKADRNIGSSKIKGIVHIDIFKFIRYIFGKNLKTDSYSLDAVASEILGSKKHEVDLSLLAPAWDNNSKELEKFAEYNLQDAKLTLELCEKLMPDIIEFSKIVGLPIFDLIRMRFSKLVESYILKRAIEYNVLAPNKPGKAEIEQRFEETYQGGFVYEPTPGMYKDIIVFDFKSLYPTIITAHNIGPESLKCDCCEEDIVPEKEEYWFCTKKKAFLPVVLENLILRRSEVKKLIKEKKGEVKSLEARSYALKILANSFYGYMGFFGARWYCLECARSTTAYARDYIKKTIDQAIKKGFKVIYADTDSCFLLLGDKKREEAFAFMYEINLDLPGQMELEYEGQYPRGIFVAAKGSDKGAKKKYALIDQEGRMKITGFETVRRNWSLLAKEVQKKVLGLVLNDKIEESLNYVRETIKELNSGKVELDKLIIKTQITKELSAYSSIGPHVAVALKMEDKGIKIVPGMVVQYIITKGTGLIREKAKLPEEVKEYDANYYLNNQLLPSVSSIFLVLGYKEEDLLNEGKQEGLSKFF